MQKKFQTFLWKLTTSFFVVLISYFSFFRVAHAADSDFWKIATTYEQKYIFVAGLRSGLLAANNRAQQKYESIAALAKELPEQDRKIVTRAAMDVWSDVSNVAILVHLDDKFIPDFIKYLDYYFTNPNNKNAGDALSIFLADRAKNR